MTPLVLRLITGFGLAVALATALWPQLDQYVARLFFAGIGAADQWPLSTYAWTHQLRWLSVYLTIALSLWALLSLIMRLIGRNMRFLASFPVAVYLLVTVLAAPVFAVNIGLKDHWQRPRPYQTRDFGGPWQFKPWWQPGGECDRNCSFVSGESSGAVWLAAPASVLPPQWRPAAYGAVALITVTASVLRMGFGRHFLSDTVLASVLTYLIIYGCHYWLFVKDNGYYAMRLRQWAKNGISIG